MIPNDHESPTSDDKNQGFRTNYFGCYLKNLDLHAHTGNEPILMFVSGWKVSDTIVYQKNTEY